MSLTITVEHLAAIAGRTIPLMSDLVEWLNRLCPLYEIDLPHEYCHFLAEVCHETCHFKVRVRKRIAFRRGLTLFP